MNNKTPRVMSNTAGQWIGAGAVWVALLVFFIWYHDVRGKPPSWSTACKSSAIASTFCIGFSLVIGPLVRRFDRLTKSLPWRRSLGIVGAVMAACHVVLTVWVLRKEFSIPWLIEHWPVTVSGLLCFLLFGLIAAVSNRWGHRRLGESRWASVQELAWIAFVLLIAHLLLLGKMPGWIKWLREFDKPLPPGALTTTVFGLIVLALRGVELIPCRRGGETKSG